MKTNFLFFVVIFSLLKQNINAQFSFNAQMLQRAEFRNGYGKTIEKNTDPAAFISQRLRIEGKYDMDYLTFYLSMQDVRTWGSEGQLKRTDNLFSLYEGWAQVKINDAFSFKVGRQELNYDNARFLGNVDWALQGRSHDFALLKFKKKNIKLDIGGGFNQNGEALTGNFFTVNNQYKTAQMVRYEQKINDFDFSFLFWNEGRQYSVKDSLDVIVDKGVRFKQTIGLPTIRYKIKNTTISGFYYHQLGRDVANNKMNGFDANIQVSQLIEFNEENKNSLRITAGAEVLSGNKSDYVGSKNKAYSPLYGTNHMHNGYMDLFYVGGAHENSVGLIDAYIKFKYDFSSKGFIAVNNHFFNAYAKIIDGVNEKNKYLGTEIDITGGYIINKAVSVQAGYSQMFNTSNLQFLHKSSNPKNIQNWAYLMLVIRPNNDRKFVAVYN